MIQESDVNSAMLQQAAEELEIGVPIRSWRVEGGELVLSLAYGGEASWSQGGSAEGPDGAPWGFEAKLRDADPAPIPKGNLRRIKKQQLRLIALGWGYQTESLDPLKAEFVEALTWARKNLLDD